MPDRASRRRARTNAALRTADGLRTASGRGTALAIAICGVAAWGPPARGAPDPATPPTVSIRVTGAPETVFRWASRACPERMIPDAPARAFRDVDGQVRLIATSYENWSLHGPSMDEARPECRSLFRGAERSDPLAFDDRGWIEAVYTLDGRTVHALVSNEWDAFRHAASGMPMRDACHVRQYTPGCMVYSINLATSSDGGRGFRYLGERGRQVVAGTAYRYGMPVRDGNVPKGEMPAPSGTPTASNIVARDGHFYAMVFSRGAGPRDDGNCLMRTDELGDATRWRAWDGEGFTIRPVDTGSDGAPASRCALVAKQVLGWDVRSLSWHAGTRSYIAIMHSASHDAEGRRVAGVHYATSPDLVRWSAARLVIKASPQLDGKCEPMIHFPSMLDPASPSRNFETVGSTGYIYYTQYNLKGCRVTLDRDLHRMPVKIEPAP